MGGQEGRVRWAGRVIQIEEGMLRVTIAMYSTEKKSWRNTPRTSTRRHEVRLEERKDTFDKACLGTSS